MMWMRLLDICDFQGGSQPPKEEWSFAEQEGYIRMLQIRDFTQSEKVTPEYIKISNCIKTCTEDDVLIARYGASIGKVLTGIAGAYNVAIMRTIPDTDIIRKRFLYYYLKSSYFQNAILNVGSRAAQAGFNKTDLAKLEITCPELSKQDKIVKILEKVESIIQKRKDQLNALDYIIKARFVEMFGTLNSPSQEFTRATLKELCNKITDGKHGGCKVEEGTERYFVGAREIYDDGVHYDTAPEINVDEFEKDYKRCNVEIGDFLIVNTGATIGKSAITTDERTEHTLLQKSVALLKVKKELLNPVFLKWCYRVNTQMYIVESASAQPNLLLSKINSTVIYVPDIELQNQFSDFVHQVDKSKLLSLIKLLEQLITYLYNVFIIYRQDKGEEVEDHE